MNKIIYILAVFALLVFSGCDVGKTDGSNKVSVGDNLVSATVIEEINASTMLNIVKATLDANATNAFGYKAVKIIYKTQNSCNWS